MFNNELLIVTGGLRSALGDLQTAYLCDANCDSFNGRQYTMAELESAAFEVTREFADQTELNGRARLLGREPFRLTYELEVALASLVAMFHAKEQTSTRDFEARVRSNVSRVLDAWKVQELKRTGDQEALVDMEIAHVQEQLKRNKV